MDPHANQFLINLAMVLCVAAVTTVIFQRLRQPVVLGYILAGLLSVRTFRSPWWPTARPSAGSPSWA